MRDYRKGAARRPRGQRGGLPTWLVLLIGLGGGAVLTAAVIHFKSRASTEPAVVQKKKRDPNAGRFDPPEPDTNSTGMDFTYATKLPNDQVIIPEKEKDAHRDILAAPETHPGTYVLQAGSYRSAEEADRRRGQLQLAGIESVVQKVSVDTDTWYRVRIGPFKSLDDLNKMRSRLRDADIDAIQMRIPD
jgi:cell division protein FtsN